MRFAFQKSGDIVAVHFQANTFFNRDSVGLMSGLVEHGSKAEELALRWLVHDDLLLILINGSDPHYAGDQNVSSSARFADLPDALALRKGLDFDLCRQHRSLFIVEQSKQGNASQYFRAARHRSPRQVRVDRGRSVQKDGIKVKRQQLAR